MIPPSQLHFELLITSRVLLFFWPLPSQMSLLVSYHVMIKPYFFFVFAHFIIYNINMKLLSQSDYIFLMTGQSSFDIPEYAPGTASADTEPLTADAPGAGTNSHLDNSPPGANSFGTALPIHPSSPTISTVLKRMQSSEFSLTLPELPPSRPTSRPPSANSISLTTCISGGALPERDSILPGMQCYHLLYTQFWEFCLSFCNIYFQGIFFIIKLYC